jgi:sulfite exporter TauE/SafE
LLGAWLAGALGGVHCLAMCGGFIAAIATRDGRAGGATALLRRRGIVLQQLGYHAGRVTTYTMLGAVFGAAGAAALQAVDLLPLQRTIYVVANVFLLLLGVSLATRTAGVGWLQRMGGSVFGAALPILRPLLQRPGAWGRITLGLVWGLVPCALVYSVLPLALFAGGVWQGVAVMLAFGVGTLPNLTATGWLLDRARPLVERAALRRAAAALLVAFAVVGIYRALYVPNSLAKGPFCLVP